MRKYLTYLFFRVFCIIKCEEVVHIPWWIVDKKYPKLSGLRKKWGDTLWKSHSNEPWWPGSQARLLRPVPVFRRMLHPARHISFRRELRLMPRSTGRGLVCGATSVIYVFYTPINYQEPRYETVTACGNETVTKHLVSNHTQVAVAGEEYHLAITASPRG